MIWFQLVFGRISMLGSPDLSVPRNISRWRGSNTHFLLEGLQAIESECQLTIIIMHFHFPSHSALFRGMNLLTTSLCFPENFEGLNRSQMSCYRLSLVKSSTKIALSTGESRDSPSFEAGDRGKPNSARLPFFYTIFSWAMRTFQYKMTTQVIRQIDGAIFKFLLKFTDLDH